jgi:hypothetical protein
VADFVGIKRDHIYFTNKVYKWRKIKDLAIDIHYDDKWGEINLIQDNTNTKCIKV